MLQYGLIGYPLGHSFSKKYFTEKFEKEKIQAEYLNFEIENLDVLPVLLEKYPNLRGFNVTIPYKQQILGYLTKQSEEAQIIGAVNCVKIERHSAGCQLIGYNTDTYGFRTALLRFIPPHIKHSLVLGNGGAAKAIRYTLQQLGISSLTVSRTPRQEQEIGYADAGAYLPDYHLIVNTTPLGTWPNTNTYPLIPYEQLTSRHYLFDLVYNPEITTFMKKGAEAGARVCNGLEMLAGQAEAGWKIWTDHSYH